MTQEKNMTYPSPLKIGILGTGHIGKTLTRRLSAAGHQVKVANSRGPETIDPETLATGATPVKAVDAVSDVDVIILSMPLSRLPQIAPVIRHLPDSVIVADTSNYYPHRDGKIDEIEAGQPESLWVSDLLGRGVIKAWNAIGSGSFASKDRQPGAPDRIAIPVAGDNEADRKLIMQLVSDTGFDGYDAGTLALSWRQQPGAPVYCTDLHHDEMSAALESAQASRLPVRRDLSVAVILERVGDSKTNPDADFGVRLSRIIFM
ncbi:NADPH-dependent F420 reductase [Klebsiella michiganensis]|uniref:NADPH-dependent F420 reductase n=1 Tax=Klebsiella michiganensis TaxID=1134687 RepID=UPI003DAA064F